MTFASWCGVCTTIAPEFKRAAKELAKLNPPIPLGVIDADKKTKEIQKDLKIDSFPVITWWKHSVPTRYNGNRDGDSIIKFVKDQTGHSAKAGLNSKYLECSEIDEARKKHNFAAFCLAEKNT